MAKLYDLVPYGDKSLVPIWNSLTEQKKKKKKKSKLSFRNTRNIIDTWLGHKYTYLIREKNLGKNG